MKMKVALFAFPQGGILQACSNAWYFHRKQGTAFLQTKALLSNWWQNDEL